MLFLFVLLDLSFTASNLILDLGLSVQNQVNLEGFVWSHQSITGLISQRQFVPKCQFLASRPLGCYSFQNILTNPIISQINTLLLPYFISYYSSAFTINQFHNHDAVVYAPQRLVTLVLHLWMIITFMGDTDCVFSEILWSSCFDCSIRTKLKFSFLSPLTFYCLKQA